MMRFAKTRTALPAAMLAAGLVLGLSSCAASSESTAAAMHDSVVQISERAAAGDFAGALAELALLERDVVTAAENGAVDADREAEIRSAMDLVRADLEAADASTPAPEPATTPAPNGDDNPDPSEDKPNKGPGNNKGNGNGNSGKDDGGDD